MTREEICERIRNRAVPMANDAELNSWCAICSTAIGIAFVDHGFDARIRIGKFWGSDDHCWVWSDDWNHYDITATQFSGYAPNSLDYDEILVVPDEDVDPCQEDGTEMYPRPWEEVDPRFVDEIEKHFRSWPIEQRPNHRKMRQLLRGLNS